MVKVLRARSQPQVQLHLESCHLVPMLLGSLLCHPCHLHAHHDGPALSQSQFSINFSCWKEATRADQHEDFSFTPGRRVGV